MIYLGYELLFYINDGFVVVTAVLVLALKVTKIKTGEQTLDSLKRIVTKPAFLLYGLVALLGYGWGVQDSYLTVYLQEIQTSIVSFITVKKLLYLLRVLPPNNNSFK